MLRVRSDGLAIIDVMKLDERLRLSTKLLSKYEPYQIQQLEEEKLQ
ncbi:hypothetical protein [Candidatus Nanopusillus massiliensis]|nr:hypothetical protein [Candidatus Nanopusillus massiliensis]